MPRRPRPEPQPRVTLAEVYRQQQFIIEYLRFLANESRFTVALLDAVTASVTRQETAEASIIALLEGLAQQIRDSAGDVDAANALADQIDADTAKLNDAVAANTTPAPPAP